MRCAISGVGAGKDVYSLSEVRTDARRDRRRFARRAGLRPLRTVFETYSTRLHAFQKTVKPQQQQPGSGIAGDPGQDARGSNPMQAASKPLPIAAETRDVWHLPDTYHAGSVCHRKVTNPGPVGIFDAAPATGSFFDVNGAQAPGQDARAPHAMHPQSEPKRYATIRSRRKTSNSPRRD